MRILLKIQGMSFMNEEKCRLERILTMVYVVQSYWACFGLYPVCGRQKIPRFGDWICLRPQMDGAGQTYSVGPVRKS
jgi:hypothetical protein